MTVKHIKTLHYLLLILMLNSCSNTSGTKAYVYDMNNKPLEGVLVQVNGSDIYTTTDEEGFFEIHSNGVNNELLFHKKDYQLKFISILAISKTDKIILTKEVKEDTLIRINFHQSE